jgi:hypothetical protein
LISLPELTVSLVSRAAAIHPFLSADFQDSRGRVDKKNLQLARRETKSLLQG